MTRRLATIALLTLLVVACKGAAPSPSPTPAPSPTPSPSPSTAAFYLRAYSTQALPPQFTFAWLPTLTVAEGILYDGNVAIDMIFPGPVTIVPFARTISEAGIAALIDEARRLGMLDGSGDFTGDAPMPGSRLAQIEMVIDGQTYSLTGNPDAIIVCVRVPCEAPPGTPAAFGAFWQALQMAGTWLGPELGPVQDWTPDRVALLLTAPTPQDMPLVPAEWPFDTSIAEAGIEFPGEEGDRCVTLSSDALAALWPILRDANQLTVLVDEQGNQAAPVVRVLVPGDESPCPDETA
ncbi:MAG: hypothetical protein ABI797_04685 [Chloroflexota bacterium]